MTLEQVREIAQEMGLKPRRSQSIREISYAILDAQADKRAADVQAKEEARAASGKTGKRERVRGVVCDGNVRCACRGAHGVLLAAVADMDCLGIYGLERAL